MSRMINVDRPTLAKAWVVGLAVCVCLAPTVAALTHTVTVSRDFRRVIDFGSFGYGGQLGGRMVLTIHHFSIADVVEYADADEPIGFVLDWVPSASFARMEQAYAVQDLNRDADGLANACFVNDPKYRSSTRFALALEKHLAQLYHRLVNNGTKNVHAALEASMKGRVMQFNISSHPGMYALFFVNCKRHNKNKLRVPVTFSISVEAYNINTDGTRNYLSYGDTHVPTLYLLFFALFFGGSVAWHRTLFHRRSTDVGNVRSIHYVMYAVAILKCASLVLNAAMLYHRRRSGTLRTAIDVAFFALMTLKGTILFAALLLLGTGWSLMRPFVPLRDKRILMLVVPLQVVVNIALAVLDETSEGSRGWSRWRTWLRPLDVVCCIAVMAPLIASIKTLSDAGEDGSSASRGVARLRQFRMFYIAAISYVYFTRIVMQYLDAALPYEFTWVSPAILEAATLAFYGTVAALYQPATLVEFRESGDRATMMQGKDVQDIDVGDA